MSWYTFFRFTDLVDGVIPLDDYPFICRLGETWSPATRVAPASASPVAGGHARPRVAEAGGLGSLVVCLGRLGGGVVREHTRAVSQFEDQLGLGLADDPVGRHMLEYEVA